MHNYSFRSQLLVGSLSAQSRVKNNFTITAPLQFSSANSNQAVVNDANVFKRHAVRWPYSELVVLTDLHEASSSLALSQEFKHGFEATLQNRHLSSQPRSALQKLWTTITLAWGRLMGTVPTIPVASYVNDIHGGSVDQLAVNLQKLVSSQNHNIHLLLVEPAQLAKSEPIILSTARYGTFVGANNGGFSLLADMLKAKNEPFQVIAIDPGKVLALYRAMHGDPQAILAGSGTALATVAAGLAAGIAPEAYRQDVAPDQSTQTNYHTTIAKSVFSENLQPLPLQVNEPIRFVAFRERTYGNLVTSVAFTPEVLTQLIQEKAAYRLDYQPEGATEPTTLTLQVSLPDADQKDAEVLFLGSTFVASPSLSAGSRLMHIAKTGGNFSRRLGVDKYDTVTCQLTRIR